MELVLLERVEKLGQMGDVVRVKAGYARNYLLPQGKALRSTKENLRRFEIERAQLEARNLELKSESEAIAAKFEEKDLTIIRQAAESGSLYGSVSARDVANAATEAGLSIDRKQVRLDRPVKELGLHEIKLVLHPEVTISVIVNVARSEEEAALQLSGRDIAEVRAEEEAAAAIDLGELLENVEDQEALAAAAEEEAAEKMSSETGNTDAEDAEADVDNPEGTSEDAADNAPDSTESKEKKS